MLSVHPDLASVAAMLFSIFAPEDLIHLDGLNDRAPRPFPGAIGNVVLPPACFKANATYNFPLSA